ncbi:NuoI/complex I 23 kDa subunit family protein [Pectinatus frisingensis]|jgi:NADH-quinone oxidoreductase subunit I|uniref:NuoI/complex I 23 kDa subunit family protein n=1 Tax=Pectinatus frisingensis TaxID=865 RepID=UPI0018C63B38|nr:NADH-quinone oxidoreductase subunit I [Pectinatus frisingensis]
MQGKGLLTGLSVTIRHFFGKKVTVQYPEEKLPMSETFRGGKLVLDQKKCIGCRLCSMACPNEALDLTVETDENKKRHMTKYIHKSGRCLYCGFCVEACPTKAVTWDKNYAIACYTRTDLTYDAVKSDGRNETHE